MKNVLLASAASLVAVSGAPAADLPVKALPAQYVKICDLYGSGFYYVPGSDTCIKVGGYVAWNFGQNHNNFNQPQYSGTGGAQDRTVSTWQSRARANIQMDSRTNTQYGTLRTQTSLHFNNQSQSETFNTARAFIQWAGFTFGRAQSYSDGFKISGGWSNLQFQTGRDTSANGVNLAAYSFDLGNDNVFSIEIAERASRPVTNLSAGGGLKVGAELTGSNAGEKWPDFSAAYRQSGDWGYWQVSALAHDTAASYYSGNGAAGSPFAGFTGCVQANTTQCGHPDDKLGFGLLFGTELRFPQFGPGDRAGFNVRWGQGWAIGNGGNNLQSPGLFGSGNFVATGFRADAFFVNGSQLELTTGWTVETAYEHFWSPIFRTSILLGYGEQTHNTQTKTWFRGVVCGVAGTGAGAAGASFTANAATNSCDPDFAVWHVASRSYWNPVPGLQFSATLGWTQIVSGFKGIASLAPAIASRPTGTYTIQDRGILSLGFQVQRLFNVPGASAE